MVADICLLRLERSASCASSNKLAVLDRPESTAAFTASGTTAVVAGWGATHTADGHAAQAGVPRWPDAAREVELPLITNAVCKNSYRGLRADMICAGGGGGIDSCQGDSGGPLVVYSNGRPVQASSRPVDDCVMTA